MDAWTESIDLEEGLDKAIELLGITIEDECSSVVSQEVSEVIESLILVKAGTLPLEVLDECINKLTIIDNEYLCEDYDEV